MKFTKMKVNKRSDVNRQYNSIEPAESDLVERVSTRQSNKSGERWVKD